MKIFLIAILFLTQTLFAQNNAASEWQFKKESNGVKVFTKNLENSSLKELKAIFQVKASLSSIVSLLNDSDEFPKWAYRCGSCTTVKKISESEFIRYQTVTAPWPVDNRDFAVTVKVTQNPVTKVVVQLVASNARAVEEKNGFVRIKIFRGIWTLTPLKNGLVNIEYQLLVDPAGSLPVWLVNMSAIDGPIENATSMKKWLVKEKYARAKVSYIKELE